MILKEARLAAPVADWLESQGYIVYSEVGGRDMVGLNDKNDLIIIELKQSATTHSKRGSTVLHQAKSAKIYTQKVFAAVATNPRQESIDKFKELGIGLISVKNNKLRIVVEPSGKDISRNKYKENLMRTLKQMQPSRKAGIPMFKGAGPAQTVLRDIKSYLVTHPDADWKEIYRCVPNYYANYKSLRGSMKQWQRFTL